MTRKPRGLTGQMEQLIESALAPGRFISYKANSASIDGARYPRRALAPLTRRSISSAGTPR